MNTSIGKWNQWSLNESKINLFLNNINADERNSIWNGIFILRIQCTHSSIHPKKTKREKKLTNNHLEMLEFCRIANKEHR